MNGSILVRSIKQLWKADGQILDLRAKRFGFKIVLTSLGILIACISIATVALGIYVALSNVVGAAAAAAILSIVSMVLAVGLLAGAARGPYVAELKNAEHDHTLAVETLKKEVLQFDVYDSKQRAPLVETILPLIAPLVSALVVEGLRQRRESETTTTTTTQEDIRA